MSRLVHLTLLPILVFGAVASSALAPASLSQIAYAQKTPPRQVQDDAGMFGAKAKEEANAEIAQIKQQFKKDLTIETVVQGPKLPADVKDKSAEAKFFDQWAISRFKNEQINGVYVVILDKPHIVRVVVGEKTLNSGLFTASNRDELRQKLIEKLKAKDADGALLAATHYVRESMSKNHVVENRGSERRSTAPVAHGGGDEPRTNWVAWILIALGVLIVVWIVLAIIRAISGAGRPGYAGGPGGGYGGGGGGGGGGGFFSSLMGGLFGAAAGMWLYNNFFGGHTNSAFGANPSDNYSGNTTSEPTDVGGGASVSGGDYGEDAGGGDAGADDGGGGGDWGGGGDGGDAGGGDWGGGGGGDWGGGGGDFGGGGGDW